MAKVLIKSETLTDIADAIRDKLDVETAYRPAEMPAAIASISTGGEPTLQEKSVDPTESAQSVTADAGYDGLSKVNVGAIPTDYVGSGVPESTVTPYVKLSYPEGQHKVTISPQASYTKGYIPNNGSRQVPSTDVTAADLVSGSETVTENGAVNVTNLAEVVVAVPTTEPKLQEKSVTPTESAQDVTADSNFDGLSKVSVGAISSTYVGSGVSKQAAKTVTPTESEQTAVASGVYTTGAVKVGAISTTYVGSGVAKRNATDLTADGPYVTVPAGYYENGALKSVAVGSTGTPVASKGTVSNNQVTITPTVNNTTGYITGGTKTGTAVTVKASELVSGSQTLTSNDTYDVTNLASVIVNVAGGGGGLPSGFTAIATGTHTLSSAVTGSGTFNVTHNLGVVPDMFLFYAQSNIATTYSMLYAFRYSAFGWRGSTYLNLCGYHGNSTSTVTATNVTTSYGVKTLSATTATITSYSTSTSYGWRTGTYEWIAIKFS